MRIVAHVQRANMQLELSLLTEALFAVLANVTTSLMDFSNVPADVSGTLELLVALQGQKEI